MEVDKEPYKVVIDSQGCHHCGAGRTYTVIGPDGVSAVSSTDEEEMQHEANVCNAAYQAGLTHTP